MNVTVNLPAFTSREIIDQEQLMNSARNGRIKSPGMDILYDLIDATVSDRVDNWDYNIQPGKGDSIESTIEGKSYKLKKENTSSGDSFYSIEVDKNGEIKQYPVAKRTYDKVLDKIKRFIDLKQLSKNTINKIRFKLHINPETHKRQLPLEDKPKGISAGALHKDMKANGPIYDPGKENINSLVKGLKSNKARIVKFEEGEILLCLLNQIQYKLEDNDGNYMLSVNTLAKDPLVFSVSKRLFDQVMNLAKDINN